MNSKLRILTLWTLEPPAYVGDLDNRQPGSGKLVRRRNGFLGITTPSVALDYWGRLRRRSHSPRAESIKVKPPNPPSAQSTHTKKKPPGDLAISP